MSPARYLLTLHLLLGAGLIAAPVIANAPAPVGIAAAVLNRVTIARGGAAQMRPAVLRQQVAQADRVETGPRSQLQLLLLDRSTFTVGANARLTIDRFVYDPATGRSMSATVAKGAFRFMSGRASRGGSSSITTPVASIGIRGTILDGVVGADAIAIANGERGIGGGRNSDPQSATLIVLRGPGANTRGNALPGAIAVSAGGKTVSLERPLLAVYVPRAGAKPIGPFAISLSGLNRMQNLIFPSLAEWRVATMPAPSGTYPVPAPQQRRSRPVMVGNPYGGEPSDDPGRGGMIPSYGTGIPSLPSMPRGSGASTPQSPPARTATTRQETVPASEPTPAAATPQYQEPPPPPPPPPPEPQPEQPAYEPPPTAIEPAPAPPPREPYYPPTPNDAPQSPGNTSAAPTYGAPDHAPPPRRTSGKN